MNVYDFDGTVYDGDSSIDFYLFCIKKKPCVFFKCIFNQLSGMVLYTLKRIPKEEYKEKFFSFLKYVPACDLLKEFWDKKFCKIKKWYLSQKRDDDLIISASPEFLLRPVCKRLGISLIASRVSPLTGKFTGPNCYGSEKAKRFKEEYTDKTIDNFYTDSTSDYALVKLAKESFIVKRDEVKVYEKKKSDC